MHLNIPLYENCDDLNKLYNGEYYHFNHEISSRERWDARTLLSLAQKDPLIKYTAVRLNRPSSRIKAIMKYPHKDEANGIKYFMPTEDIWQVLYSVFPIFTKHIDSQF